MTGYFTQIVWSRVLRKSSIERMSAAQQFILKIPNRLGPHILGRLPKIAWRKPGFASMPSLRGISLGLLALVVSYSTVDFQDVEGLASGGNRWLVHAPAAPGETIVASNYVAKSANQQTQGIDYRTTSSVRPQRLTTVKGDRVTIAAVTSQIRPDKRPQTINRDLKGDRVVSSSIARPPAHFSAGSVVQRHSLLAPLDTDRKLELAFVTPKPHGEALRVAAAFHLKNAKYLKEVERLPVMVASLVRESEDSVLAYSPEPEVAPFPVCGRFAGRRPCVDYSKIEQGRSFLG